MRLQLSEKDRKELKFQCRAGYIFGVMIFFIGAVASAFFFKTAFMEETNAEEIQIGFIVILSSFFLSFLVGFLINRKYLADLRYNVKEIEPKVIERKKSKEDFEADIERPRSYRMTSYARYDLIIENTKYKVSKDFFDKCSEGDEVIFNIAPISGYLLGIDKK
jgi:cell division protein FtsL